MEALDLITRKYVSALPVAISKGIFPRKYLPRLAEQMYLQEKWPSHIAHVYLNLDEHGIADRALIRYIISIIRAENLGVGSGSIPHHSLATRFAHFAGVSQQRLQRARPIPANQALMDWCDMSAQGRNWKEALAVHLACESQFSSMRLIASGLCRHYGATRGDIAFWEIHAGRCERGHARRGRDVLARHVHKSEVSGILYYFERSCELVHKFYDAIRGPNA